MMELQRSCGVLFGALLSALVAEQVNANTLTDFCGLYSAEDFVNDLVMDHDEFVITNAQFTGACQAGGRLDFAGNTHYIEQEICGSALVLTSGSMSTAIDTSNTGEAVTTANGQPGDSDLDAIAGSGINTFDAAVIEFDVTSTAQNDVSVTFKYVFASEEYNEFAGTVFNDLFAFFVEGANVAKVRVIGTDDEFVDVTINTVNKDTNGQYFEDNDLMSGAFLNTEYDGVTHLLETIPFVLKPGVPTHIKLAVADRTDARYDSTVYLQASSFLEFSMCPYDLQPCSGSQCNCAESGDCRVCNNDVCCQCSAGFWRLSLSHKCIDCGDTFPGCKRCQDFGGCVECEQGYKLVTNDDCGGIKECVPEGDECPRYRRPWHLLSDDERDLYIEGFLALQQNGDIPHLLAEVHHLAWDPAHGGSGFFPWHRYFLYEIETQIRNLGGKFACFGMPYWDWGHDSLDGFLSNIFSSGLSDGGPGCVGGPNFDLSNYYTSAPGECLRRYSSPSALSFQTSATLVQAILTEPIFGTNTGFRSTFEGYHGTPHCAIGGDMCSSTSPYDPIFYLHHCYIDFLWAVWQDCHEYDLVDKNDLDCKINIYDEFSWAGEPTGLDVEMDFNLLGSFSWSVLNDYNPTHRDMHDITEWNMIYDKGTFWSEGLVDHVFNCHDRMNDEWFIGSVGGGRRRMQEVCEIDLQKCNTGNVKCGCDQLVPNTCNICHEGQGCSQCAEGYFMKNQNHRCVNCQDLFGDSCKFCQDHHGCGQCNEGYTRVYDDACKIYKCESNDPDATPAPTGIDYISRFQTILEDIMSVGPLTVPERRELVKDEFCRINRDLNIEQGHVLECIVPDDFEDCSDMEIPPGQGDISITLEELNNKPGVVDTPCLQEIRSIMYPWLSETGGLLELCNGFWDPQC